jgi:hypothetical protein
MTDIAAGVGRRRGAGRAGRAGRRAARDQHRDGDADLAAGEDGTARLNDADGDAVALREDRGADLDRADPLAGEDETVVTTGPVGSA